MTQYVFLRNKKNDVHDFQRKQVNSVFVLSYARSDFVSSDNESHLSTPGINKAGPAGVQGDVISILTAQSHRRVLKRRLTSIF